MSSVMMLNHLHEEAIAKKIKTAYDAVLAEGKSLTRDLGGTGYHADAAAAKRACLRAQHQAPLSFIQLGQDQRQLARQGRLLIHPRSIVDLLRLFKLFFD